MIRVRYGRHGVLGEEEFESFAEAVAWIDHQEEYGEIFAVAISDENGDLYTSDHPLDPPRWKKQRDDAPDFPLKPGSPEWKARAHELMGEVDHDGWWWLSFADTDRPEGDRFLGVAVVRGTNVFTAAVKAHILGINPGGEVAGWPLSPGDVPPTELRERLLSKAELEEAGLT